MEYLSLQLCNTVYMASLSHNSAYPPRFIFKSIILRKRGGGAGSGSQKEGCFKKGDMLLFEPKVLSLFYGLEFGFRTILPVGKHALKNDILVQCNTIGNLAIKLPKPTIPLNPESRNVQDGGRSL